MQRTTWRQSSCVEEHGAKAVTHPASGAMSDVNEANSVACVGTNGPRSSECRVSDTCARMRAPAAARVVRTAFTVERRPHAACEKVARRPPSAPADHRFRRVVVVVVVVVVAAVAAAGRRRRRRRPCHHASCSRLSSQALASSTRVRFEHARPRPRRDAMVWCDSLALVTQRPRYAMSGILRSI